MRMLVCGGRLFSDQLKLNARLDQIYGGFRDGLEDVLINGDAEGADKLSTMWATLSLPQMKLELYPVLQEEWRLYGKSAGPRRNTRMAKESNPDLAVVFRGGAGTRHMLTQLIAFQCPIIIQVH